MNGIFISYARKYELFARKLATSLSGVGVRVWLDVENIPAGMNWSSAIQQGLDFADLMILILTPEAMDSENVAHEWQYYLDEKKIIIPILLVPPPKVHFQIRRLQYVDFHTQSYEDAFAKLAHELQKNGFSLNASDPALTPKFSSSSLSALGGQSSVQRASPSLLPAPFAWVKIPSGDVTLHTRGMFNGYLGKRKTFHVPTFDIAKYPVTNAQFAKFMEAGGYHERRWWTNDGWEARQKGWTWFKDKWTASNLVWSRPYYWKDAKWNSPEHPVVGVSWHEAIAFCRWMREVTGEHISLPTEQQWQRAAQANPDGTDSEFQYVWGKAWQSGRCNTGETFISQTTSVRAYENKGNVSLCGVVDLLGNVGEWCLTDDDTGEQTEEGTSKRIFRGGSWRELEYASSCTSRVGVGFPYMRNNSLGFRLAVAGN